MGLSEHAAIHHQHAIEYANRMGSKAPEPIRPKASRLSSVTCSGCTVLHRSGLGESDEQAKRIPGVATACFKVGNLGIASAAQGDLQTSRICLQ